MDKIELLNLLQQFKAGDLSEEQALNKLKNLPFEDLGYVKIDHHRALRNGFPEVIFGLGKTPQQVADIFFKLSQRNNNVLATKVEEEAYQYVIRQCPQAVFHQQAKLITYTREDHQSKRGSILVVAAGTADLPIAEEAAISAEIMGNKVTRLYDVGVAGIHRLLANVHYFDEAQIVIVVAGMEGALASVVGGLVSQPVIAVPTSVGYGANFKGVSALLCMLNSCASGVSVVNIDNGFGAAAMANAIAITIEKAVQDKK